MYVYIREAAKNVLHYSGPTIKLIIIDILLQVEISKLKLIMLAIKFGWQSRCLLIGFCCNIWRKKNMALLIQRLWGEKSCQKPSSAILS